MWVRRMAMDFSKQTWPKSLDGFLRLGSALKDAMAWEDPTYRNKPKKMRRKRQAICRSGLIKAVRRFLNETDKAHALVETSEFYDAENEDYWNWKMKEEQISSGCYDSNEMQSNFQIAMKFGLRCCGPPTARRCRFGRAIHQRRHRNRLFFAHVFEI